MDYKATIRCIMKNGYDHFEVHYIMNVKDEEDLQRRIQEECQDILESDDSVQAAEGHTWEEF